MSFRNNSLISNGTIEQYSSKFFLLKQNTLKKNDKNFKKIIKLIDKDDWILDTGAYSNLDMKNFMKNIIEAHVLKLWLGYNVRQSIIVQIVSINFPCLKSICLSHNQIYSIQALSFINFAKIEQIQLKQNLIRSIIPLQKLNVPQLKMLSLYQNNNLDLKPFTKISSRSLKTLWLQYQDDQPVQGQSLFWFSKLQTQQLKGLAVGSSKRIKQIPIDRSLFKKYSNLKVYRALK